MPLDHVRIADLSVSRFILGSNPISGFSHQSLEADNRMMRYFTTDRIKSILREAESLGVNTLIARADHHIMRVLMEYWDEGGSIQWFAQTCPELGSIERGVTNAVRGGAVACHIHGGVMDHLLAQGRTREVAPAVAMMRDAGIAAGIAGHNPDVFRWANNAALDVDYYMCCYYNPTSRDDDPEHAPGAKEWFRQEDRQIMADTIATLSRPAIHYKVLAAGRNDPQDAFNFVAQHLRPNDAVCVGVYTEHNPHMLAHDLALFTDRVKGSHLK